MAANTAPVYRRVLGLEAVPSAEQAFVTNKRRLEA
jgi:hypothetical protein